MRFSSPLFSAWWSPGGAIVPPTTLPPSWTQPLRTPQNWVVPETVAPIVVTQ